MIINQINDLNSLIKEVEKLSSCISTMHDEIERLNKIKNDMQMPLLLTTQDVIKITGWSRRRVLDLFLDPSLSVIDIGKGKQVEVSELIRYLNIPQSYDTSKYWNAVITKENRERK